MLRYPAACWPPGSPCRAPGRLSTDTGCAELYETERVFACVCNTTILPAVPQCAPPGDGNFAVLTHSRLEGTTRKEGRGEQGKAATLGPPASRFQRQFSTERAAAAQRRGLPELRPAGPGGGCDSSPLQGAAAEDPTQPTRSAAVGPAGAPRGHKNRRLFASSLFPNLNRHTEGSS